MATASLIHDSGSLVLQHSLPDFRLASIVMMSVKPLLPAAPIDRPSIILSLDSLAIICSTSGRANLIAGNEFRPDMTQDLMREFLASVGLWDTL
jgi:hypothetical protein